MVVEDKTGRPATVNETELEGGGIRLSLSQRRSPETLTPEWPPRREPARVITMVWGDRYVSDLLSLTIPAALAPGNLPTFAQQFDCDFVIVTEVRVFERIARAPVTYQLLQHCDVRLLPIDDLLSPWYGITLTYALVRGFVDLGAEMTKSHLVFLNADFILANGSLGKLAEMIRRGERLIVAPSYCMVLEDAVERLTAHYDPVTCSLAIAPREMAAAIIAHRHNTIRAKTVNQRLFRIHRYDQFYWCVDEQTLLAHQMPIAVVYMRPERVISEMPTFWDYGVISECCPTVKPCVLGDSDDYLMGELRADGTFRDFLHLGWPAIEEIAADLSSFTTVDHRVYGQYTLVLHAGDLPAELELDKEKLRDYVASVYRRLSPPISYRNHHFWDASIERFQVMREEKSRALHQGDMARSTLRGTRRYVARRNRILELRSQLFELNGELQRGQQTAAAGEADLKARLSQETDRIVRAIDALRRERDELQRPLRERRLAMDQECLALLAEHEAEIAHVSGGGAGVSGSLAALTAGAGEPNLAELAPAVRRDIGGPQKLSAVARLRLSAARVYYKLFGQLPRTTQWHPYHTVIRHALSAVTEAAGQGGNVLIVSSGGTLGGLLARGLPGRKVTVLPKMMLARPHQEVVQDDIKFSLCLCDLAFEELLQFRGLLEKLRPLMAAPAKVIVFYHNAGLRALDEWTFAFTKNLFPLIGDSSISFAGSSSGAIAMRWFARLVERHQISTPIGMLRFTGALGVCAGIARLAAWQEDRRGRQTLPRRCTSMTIEIDLKAAR
jgi:hypothetical protein